jgi:ferric-dicitrate binding protein FerR (iron transport regulator)
MGADAAAAFWIVRADSRELDPGEIALRDAWLADPANLAAYQQSIRTLALLDAAGVEAIRVRSDMTLQRVMDFGDLS